MTSTILGIIIIAIIILGLLMCYNRNMNNTTEGFWNNYYDGYNRYYNPYYTPYYYPYYSYANLFPYYYPYYTYYTPCMQTVTGAVVCER